MTESTYTPVGDHGRLQASAELHAAQDERHIEAAVDYLRDAGQTPPYRVLDVGCGFGTVTHSRFGNDSRFTVIGVDRNREALSVAADEYAAPNIDYIQADVDSLPETLQVSADIVFSSYLLHHVDGAKTALHNLWGHVGRPGVLIVRSCDDGQHMHYPDDDDVAFLVRNTNLLDGSSDRRHGRRLYTEMKGLSPAPLDVQLDIENYHTAGCDRETRHQYWKVFHSGRTRYAKVQAEREANTDTRSTVAQELYQHMQECRDRAYERIVEDDSTLDVKSVPMGVAYKPLPQPEQ